MYVLLVVDFKSKPAKTNHRKQSEVQSQKARTLFCVQWWSEHEREKNPWKQIKLFRGLVLFWTSYCCTMNSNPACCRETTSAVLLILPLWFTLKLEHVLHLLRKMNVRRSGRGRSELCMERGWTNLAGRMPGTFLFLPRLVDFNMSRSAFTSLAHQSQTVP